MPRAPLPHRPPHQLFTRLPEPRPPLALPGRQQRAPRAPAALSPAAPRRRSLWPPQSQGRPVRLGSEGPAARARQRRDSAPGGSPSAPQPAARGGPRPAGLGRAGAAPVFSASPQGRQFPAQPTPTAAPAPRPPPGLAPRPHTAPAFTHGQGTGHGSVSVQSTAAAYLQNHFLSSIHIAYLTVAFSMAGTPKLSSPGEHL